MPEAKHVELDVPSIVYPSGQLYNARWPNFNPSKRNVNGGNGSGCCGQFDAEEMNV